jgi:hypothetical protein
MSTDDAPFLGTGWSFPPTFRRGGAEVAMVSGSTDIHQCLHILLSTRLGERIMQDEFGCALDSIVFEEIDQGLINTLNHTITDAILYHEPRIILDELDVSESADEPGLLLISLIYTIRGTNSRFNMVYPFYINEASPGA